MKVVIAARGQFGTQATRTKSLSIEILTSGNYVTAICTSIERFPQDTAPIFCLPFDRARHLGTWLKT